MTPEELIIKLAQAVVDAGEHWCDHNWPYGPDRIEFQDKHAEAIKAAKQLINEPAQLSYTWAKDQSGHVLKHVPQKTYINGICIHEQ